ncbi:hypothetical protein Kpol_1020p51 [Vanderwaltozyma polyspora DSM 70294]|uniref:Uncharacterized protein n=1 Tax=Vanderwaltozyma polyspora (strain ATCC 22028 / DSM 70294 / BCRC 21397 / CBS 2163 / NBRC 10782 / NRRL Y-8283 / UCD 57-17) TaxID=436907 RepID=A7TLG0_VANPO|nr:uncharacterized protein Kpol_1020p51 [Vanderwaltozyma polyspora DSM 70294]EDO16941.1 hypothetical protein Kpol_1020p51 [Vanderwaltozyma polyspora DSM 70294]
MAKKITITIPTSTQALYRLISLVLLFSATIALIFNGNKLFKKESALSRKKNMIFDNDQNEIVDVKYDPNFKYVKYNNPEYSGKKVRATFVTLARNKDLEGLLPTIKSLEDRFNSKFHYDWVFLNDDEFTDTFKRTVSAMISGEAKFGVIPKEHWSFPSWIDQDRAKKVREEMKEKKIIYGDSISYRHMCRFESGFFWRHPLLDEYEFYWRVEPDVSLHCDIDYDIFRFMKDNNKKYGFTISIKEYVATIPTLWKTTTEFMQLHPEFLAKDNMLDFVSDDEGKTYNLCHFWSNFEIASLDFWRGDAYTQYFEFLDNAGGFFYERWGDAPVHSIAASLFLNRDEVHHFGDLGYFHNPFHQCPIDEVFRLGNRCACNPKDDFTWKGYSCGTKYYDVNKLKKPENWEKFK